MREREADREADRERQRLQDIDSAKSMCKFPSTSPQLSDLTQKYLSWVVEMQN
jgi:hypothetical protein